VALSWYPRCVDRFHGRITGRVEAKPGAPPQGHTTLRVGSWPSGQSPPLNAGRNRPTAASVLSPLRMYTISHEVHEVRIIVPICVVDIPQPGVPDLSPKSVLTEPARRRRIGAPRASGQQGDRASLDVVSRRAVGHVQPEKRHHPDVSADRHLDLLLQRLMAVLVPVVAHFVTEMVAMTGTTSDAPATTCNSVS